MAISSVQIKEQHVLWNVVEKIGKNYVLECSEVKISPNKKLLKYINAVEILFCFVHHC